MIISVTNRKLCKVNFLERIEEIAKGKPHGIILREKDLTEEEYTVLLEACNAICETYAVPLIAHTYLHAAEKLNIQCIHFSMTDFLKHQGAVETFQQVGVSIHSVEEAKQAASLGATYLTSGHIFATNSKKGLPSRGLEFVKAVCDATTVPVFAIGGLTEETVPLVISAGATGICIMSELMACQNPTESIIRYHQIF